MTFCFNCFSESKITREGMGKLERAGRTVGRGLIITEDLSDAFPKKWCPVTQANGEEKVGSAVRLCGRGSGASFSVYVSHTRER